MKHGKDLIVLFQAIKLYKQKDCSESELYIRCFNIVAKYLNTVFKIVLLIFAFAGMKFKQLPTTYLTFPSTQTKQ